MRPNGLLSSSAPQLVPQRALTLGETRRQTRSSLPSSKCARLAFCSEEALPLTSAVAEELGVRIKRTSSRVRSAENAPDADEQAALAYFERELEEGNPLPQHLIRRVDAETRYYRPIVVAELCTTCHGPRDALGPEVRAVLDERYPEDQATGYAAGDFRGLIRVTVAATDR